MKALGWEREEGISVRLTEVELMTGGQLGGGAQVGLDLGLPQGFAGR